MYRTKYMKNKTKILKNKGSLKFWSPNLKRKSLNNYIRQKFTGGCKPLIFGKQINHIFIKKNNKIQNRIV